MATLRQRQRLLAAVAAAEQRSTTATRHKCFLSYHADDADDADEVAAFAETFGDVFIPRVIGISDEDDFIDSTNTDYVMEQVRERYLTESTVTIILIGRCTWARRYVDWEIYSTLRNDRNNRRSGLFGITLPSVANDSWRQAPPRLADNLIGTNNADGYARWYTYPATSSALRSCIDGAYNARTTRAHLSVNTRPRKVDSSPCA